MLRDFDSSLEPGLQDLTPSDGLLPTVMAAIPTGIAVMDQSGMVLFHNRAFAETFGYGTAETVPPLHKLVAPQDRSLVHSIHRRFARRGLATPWPPTVTFAQRSGRLVHLAVTERLAVFDGRGVVVQDIRDVTTIVESGRRAREGEAHVRAALDATPLALVFLTPEGDPRFRNRAYADQVGYSPAELAELTFDQLTVPQSESVADAAMAAVLRGDDVGAIELELLHQDGHTIEVELRVARIELEERVLGLMATFRDVTAERTVTGALKENRRQHRKAQELAHLGHWDRNFVTNELIWSDEVYRIFGLKRGQSSPSGLSFLQSLHPDDRSMVQLAIQRAVERGEAYDCHHRVVRPDGTIRFVREVGDVVRTDDGTALHMLGTVLDVTEMTEIREELATRTREQQALVQRLLTAEEEERRTVAHEIHDGPVQQLAAAHMFLETFAHESNIDYSLESGQRLERAKSLLESGLSETRRIMSGLRPVQLDDLGLQEALRQLLRSSGRDAEVDVDLSGIQSVGYYPPEVEITLYRVAQEATSNALRHSGTERLSVCLAVDDVGVYLEIRDWGSGFDPGSTPGPSAGHHYGLVGMRERVALLGGEVEVISDLGQGTTIKVTVPHASAH